MAHLDQLPKQFSPFLEKIASTCTPCIEFELDHAAQGEAWQSCLGQSVYLPCKVAYPTSKITGEPLQFLAQINFTDLPKLEHFPEQGIVQFYLNMKEMDLGVDENLAQLQINHRVLYFSEVIEDHEQRQSPEDLQTLSKIEEDETELWLLPSRFVHFKIVQQYMSFFDYRFAPLLFGREQVASSDDYADLTYAYEQYQIPYTESFQVEGGHRIGGYANYLHSTDNRIAMGIEDHVLLLQLDTDEGLEWCDGGIAQWYIHPDDLKKCDFSKVVFLWACH